MFDFLLKLEVDSSDSPLGLETADASESILLDLSGFFVEVIDFAVCWYILANGPNYTRLTLS